MGNQRRHHYYNIDTTNIDIRKGCQEFAKNSGLSFMSKDYQSNVIYVSMPTSYLNAYLTYGIFTRLKRTVNKLEIDSTLIKRFIGISLIMSAVRHPKFEMYWDGITRMDSIAESMTLSVFRIIITHLQFSYKTDDKREDKLYMIRPLIDNIKKRCRKIPSPLDVAVAMMVISSRGRTIIIDKDTQIPEGLLIFILVAPDGTLLDIEPYQGYDAFIEAIKRTEFDISQYKNLSLTEAAVLSFVKRVPYGTRFYLDEKFTTIRLLQILGINGVFTTGCIIKKLIPKEADFKHDGRQIQVKVRDDADHNLILWYNNRKGKQDYLISNIFQYDPVQQYQRWSKKKNKYYHTNCPNIIWQYNNCMNGVDILRKMIIDDNRSFRTGKYKVDLILALIDITCNNAWKEYRRDCYKTSITPVDLKTFKYEIADKYMS
uniref:PiggyBac transposable element n=1 Tax=Trachysalambria curvirostris majanivirus TaxID=2984281 RepID=A0A9C7C6P2_9VIRU|nr:MAG: piggyBac transposable element [Trachysalambria curvirostris majanivirus]